MTSFFAQKQKYPPQHFIINNTRVYIHSLKTRSVTWCDFSHYIYKIKSPHRLSNGREGSSYRAWACSAGPPGRAPRVVVDSAVSEDSSWCSFPWEANSCSWSPRESGRVPRASSSFPPWRAWGASTSAWPRTGRWSRRDPFLRPGTFLPSCPIVPRSRWLRSAGGPASFPRIRRPIVILAKHSRSGNSRKFETRHDTIPIIYKIRGTKVSLGIIDVANGLWSDNAM